LSADLHTVYLSLGTNLGRRAANLRAALAAMLPKVQVRRASPVYETEPWGYADQSPFLNQVIETETRLEPADLIVFLKNMESELGRQPTFRNGPRVIDIDVLFYDDRVVESESLAIPHPRLEGRAFILVPLADLAPDLIHPLLGKTVREMLAPLDRSGIRPVMRSMPAFGSRTFVMGVRNMTPYSFSGDGLLQQSQITSTQAALDQARRFVEAGVDILDVGGESTRPGAKQVSEPEEMERVLPVIEALAGEFDVLISVDTYKSRVAAAALAAGADWVNDIWGLRADPELADVISRAGAPVVLMHNRLKPATAELQERLGGRYVGVHYDNLLVDIQNELLESAALARAAGIADEQIILDPGLGFGKTVEQNLELIARLDEICGLGYPVLLGPSRKSFIGYTLNLPPDQRLEGTAAAVSMGITRGADIIRVHDVEFMIRIARMTDALMRWGKGAEHSGGV